MKLINILKALKSNDPKPDELDTIREEIIRSMNEAIRKARKTRNLVVAFVKENTFEVKVKKRR